MNASVRMNVVLIAFCVIAMDARASWFSEITGVDVDVNKGTVSVKPPNLAAIPQMLQHLPKDVGQALLNPAAPIVAQAIRTSRQQAINRGVSPIPPGVRQQLAPYFPAAVLDRVRWTNANGISLDGALSNWFGQEGAITYDEVIAFASNSNDVALWAHELTHVLQYAQMGIDSFAFQYTVNWGGLEGQASDNSSKIMASINRTKAGQAPSWGYQGTIVAPSQRMQWSQVTQAAKLAIPPAQCIWINYQINMTGNNCPVPIRVAGVVVQNLYNGQQFTMPCNEPTCLFMPNQQGPLLSPQGHRIVGVTAAYQQ